MVTNKDPFLIHADIVAYDISTMVWYKILYLYAFATHGFKPRTILFYPNKPEVFHSLYRICRRLGYNITNDPTVKADVVFAFDDTTVRTANPILDTLSKNRKVINIGCGDISKERVEKIFKEVFGYGTFVDPATFTGKCAKKSNNNALHDGVEIQCPIQPEPGFIYQRIFNNVRDGKIVDLRIPIIGQTIPYVWERSKNINDRFGRTVYVEMFDTNEKLSPEEIEKVQLFCKKFGLDYGEMDAIRDGNDGKLYIVDANNTPAYPRPGRQMDKARYNLYLNRNAEALERELLTKK